MLHGFEVSSLCLNKIPHGKVCSYKIEKLQTVLIYKLDNLLPTFSAKHPQYKRDDIFPRFLKLKIWVF